MEHHAPVSAHADTPEGRSIRGDLQATLANAVSGFGTHRCAQMAAAISYWALFSLFPLVLAIVAVAGFFVDRQTVETQLIEWITENVSVTPEGRQDIERLLSGAVSGLGAIGLLGLVGLLWSSASLMSAIRNGVNAAWGTQTRRHFVRGKLLDLALVAGFGALFGASLALTLFIRLVLDRSELDGALGGLVSALWSAGTVVVPILFSFGAFLAVYRLLPPVRTRYADVWIGALLASALFEGAKVGLAIYFQHFSNYSEVYGSLGAVISFLFFVYVAACILLLGAEVAAAWPRARVGAYDGGPDEGFRGWLREQVEQIRADKPPDALTRRRDPGAPRERDPRP